jgi:hypothetical protein
MPCAKNSSSRKKGSTMVPIFIRVRYFACWGAQYPYIWSRQGSRMVSEYVVERLENIKIISPRIEYPGPKMPAYVPLMAKKALGRLKIIL